MLRMNSIRLHKTLSQKIQAVPLKDTMRVENLKEETMIEANRRPTVVAVEEIMIK